MAKLNTVEDITKEELNKLREKVEKSGGKAIVLVHPFYYSQKESEVKVSEELIKKSKFPVIILEESEGIPALKQKLKRLNVNSLFILPTVSSDPRLKVKGAIKKLINIIIPSRKLISILANAGIKKVFIGGMETRNKPNASVFVYERKWLPKTRKPAMVPVADGCAGVIYQRLINSGKFDAIRLIPGTAFPDKPEYKLKSPKTKPRNALRKPKFH